MSAAGGIVVVVEHDGERVLSNLDTLAAAARWVAAGCGKVAAVLAGRRVARPAAAVAAATGWQVIGIENEALSPFHGELHKAVLAEYFVHDPPRWVIMAHSAAAQELAPGLALRLGGVCISGVQEAAGDDGRAAFRRPVFGGKLMATVVPEGRPVIVTVLPGLSGAGPVPAPERPGHVQVITAACPAPAARVLGRRNAEAPGAAITEARTIVAAGNGVGSPEQMDMVAALARCFPRSAVAGSRPVCDRGWLPHSLQVGLTGTTVRPDLYVACGISGAFQHVAGIREAGFIVAINRDPQAAIFQVADVGVVADLAEFLPVLIEVLEAHRKGDENHGVHGDHGEEKTKNGCE